MNEKKTSWIREAIPYVIILAVVLLIRIFILVNATIPTESMVNTIPVGSRVMGLKCAYWFSEPQRGEIIVFDAPDEPGTLYVKRLIGLPGDTVEIVGVEKEVDGQMISTAEVRVNGVALEEDYLPEPMEYENLGPFEVPEDCYFFLGDNRNWSLDARYWTNTYVHKDAIQGRVYLRYWKTPAWIGTVPDYGELS